MDTRHQSQVPESKQIVLAICTAVLTSIEHFESAKILLEKKKPRQAYALWIFGIEEIGKISLYYKCLHEDANRRQTAWDTHKDAFKDHKQKIGAFLDLLVQFTKQETNKPVSLKFSVDLGSAIANEQVDRLIQAHNKGVLRDILHKVRECATYTTINDDAVFAPSRGLAYFPAGLLEVVINMSNNASFVVDKFFSEIFGTAYAQLRRHFEILNPTEEERSYARLEQTFGRIFPALLTVARKGSEVSIVDDGLKDLIKGANVDLRKLITILSLLKKVIELAAGEEELSPWPSA